MRRTKVVCTIGPATAAPERIRDLVDRGMDVARINLSHGSVEEHRTAIRRLREAEVEAGRPVAILADLQGPRIRIGELPEPVRLAEGASVVLAPEGKAGDGALPTTHEALARDLSPGDRVLLDDGRLELRCEAVEDDRVRLRVIRGGELASHKGINLPSGTPSIPALTDKDLRDLEFLLEEGVECVSLSFVGSGADVRALRERIGGRALVVAKIERACALDRLEEILEACDMVMVARGDLGVELPFEAVPLAQKRIIQLANLYARPVITATQMLDSMVSQPRPTRAEASDVANAVLDGTDAVMLSGETAIGRYPGLAVDALVRIVEEIEGSGVLEAGPRYLVDPGPDGRRGASRREHAVASATVDALRTLDAPAVLVITRSGFSARLVASHRPPVPIFAVTTDARTCHQLLPVWGVTPLLAGDIQVNYEGLRDFGRRAILAAGAGVPGDTIVVTSGFPFHEAGSTNTLRVEPL